jgi:CRP-like cAMP-binding protein
MREYQDILLKSPLFQGVSAQELSDMLACLSAFRTDYGRGQFILRCGDHTGAMGMVLAGSVHILKEDFWGNQNIMAQATPGQLFAETYACVPGTSLSVSVMAAEPAAVLFLDTGRLLSTCTSACPFHVRLIRNLLSVLAGKNLMLNEKLTHLSQRTTREKLLSYLSAEARRRNSSTFEIPFNRQQLADYLSVDRSAMSAELGKMQREGLLSFDRSRFTLHHV